MVQWAFEFEVSSRVHLTDEQEMLFGEMFGGEITFEISNKLVPDFGPSILRVRAFFESDSFENAKLQAEEIPRPILRRLSFVTSANLTSASLKYLIDYSEGATGQRKAALYLDVPNVKSAQILNEKRFASMNHLANPAKSNALEQCLKWYRTGVDIEFDEKAFQSFWHVIEISSQVNADRTKVADKCQKCGGPLRCDECGSVSEHRPFEKQKIKKLMEELNVPPHIIESLFAIRNQLAHGSSIEDIEDYLMKKDGAHVDFDKPLNAVAKIAHDSILVRHCVTTLASPIDVLWPRFFSTKKLRASVDLRFTPSLVDGRPDLDNLKFPTLSILHEEEEIASTSETNEEQA